MGKLLIAFLFNVRHRYHDPHDPRFELEVDFDDPKTIKAIEDNLQQAGYQVLPIEANRQAYAILKKNRRRIDLVFNYAEGIYGHDREAQLPAILEMLQISYTGSGPLTQCLCLNKAKAKEVLLINQVPVLPSQLFETSKDKLPRKLQFPLLVKPLSQGSSAGITQQSIVNNYDQLRAQVKKIIRTFKQPALVEPFLKGREFSIGMWGNPPKLLPIIEPDFTKLPKNYLPLDSLEVKWIYEEEGKENHLQCPAKVSRQLSQLLEKICLKTWEALEIQDWCRVDLRCDEANRPYVLEVNSPAGLIPPELSQASYFPLAARAAGIKYQELLKKIVNTALRRYGKI
ncbi:MAG TPA: D-alanine--D-alanine ligase [Candidatus Bathyarchaeia archaeon]|nr:D-alanine--D-alanine ligase [Candidatus Bathyarchaeia archaeon]